MSFNRFYFNITNFRKKTKLLLCNTEKIKKKKIPHVAYFKNVISQIKDDSRYPKLILYVNFIPRKLKITNLNKNFIEIFD